MLPSGRKRYGLSATYGFRTLSVGANTISFKSGAFTNSCRTLNICPTIDGFYTPGYGFAYHEVYIQAKEPSTNAVITVASSFKCVIPGRDIGSSNVVSVAVTAGQTLRFYLQTTAMRGNDKGSGEQARIVVTPSP